MLNYIFIERCRKRTADIWTESITAETNPKQIHFLWPIFFHRVAFSDDPDMQQKIF